MEPSVVCLGITDAGRCCFDKTTASLAGCCGAITSSYIFQKYRALGHLARKWKFRKKTKKKLVICRSRLVFMITGSFQRFAQPRQLRLSWFRSPVMMPGVLNISRLIFFLSILLISPERDQLWTRRRIKLKLLGACCHGRLKLPHYSLHAASYNRAVIQQAPQH